MQVIGDRDRGRISRPVPPTTYHLPLRESPFRQESARRRKRFASMGGERMKTIAAVVLAVVTAFAVAQEQGLPAFREAVEVRVMDLDVVVTDSKGRPVPDVKQEEFSVKVDGKPVPIDDFARVEEGAIHAPDLASAPPERVLAEYRKGEDGMSRGISNLRGRRASLPAQPQPGARGSAGSRDPARSPPQPPASPAPAPYRTVDKPRGSPIAPRDTWGKRKRPRWRNSQPRILPAHSLPSGHSLPAPPELCRSGAIPRQTQDEPPGIPRGGREIFPGNGRCRSSTSSRHDPSRAWPWTVPRSFHKLDRSPRSRILKSFP